MAHFSEVFINSLRHSPNIGTVWPKSLSLGHLPQSFVFSNGTNDTVQLSYASWYFIPTSNINLSINDAFLLLVLGVLKLFVFAF